MDAEPGDRLWRRIGVLGEEKLRRGFFRGGKPFGARERQTCEKVRPTKPLGRLRRVNLPEEIAGAPHRAAAALVKAVFGDVQLAARREREPERIAQSPRDEFNVARAAGRLRR